MNKHKFLVVLIFFLAVLISGCDKTPPPKDNFKLPPGFKMKKVIGNLKGARMMVFNTDGKRFWVSQPRVGKVTMFEDNNLDGKFEKSVTYLEGLKDGEGLLYRNGILYVSESSRIISTYDKDGDGHPDEIFTLVADLPKKGLHKSRNMKFGRDGRLYVAIGSSCNLCEEEYPNRAAIVSYNKDGRKIEIFASGLRDPVDFDWDPKTGNMWCSESSRAFFRDDYPGDEINLVEKNKNYGWPYCFSSDKIDLEYRKTLSDFEDNFKIKGSFENYCKNTVNPKIYLDGHTRPKGIIFYTGKNFPPEYRNNLFVALNGDKDSSYHRGFKVIRLVIDGDKVIKKSDFITGWFQGNIYDTTRKKIKGSPYGLVVAPDGSLYVSDNIQGVIYRVYWDGAK